MLWKKNLLQVGLVHGKHYYLHNWPLSAFWTAFTKTCTSSQHSRPSIDAVYLFVNILKMQHTTLGPKKRVIFPFLLNVGFQQIYWKLESLVNTWASLACQ